MSVSSLNILLLKMPSSAAPSASHNLFAVVKSKNLITDYKNKYQNNEKFEML